MKLTIINLDDKSAFGRLILLIINWYCQDRNIEQKFIMIHILEQGNR